MSAVISDCGQYRYRLDRDVQITGIVIAYFGVNPSTAGPLVEDSTTRKWRGFTCINGGRRYIAGNPFAFRSTDVRKLAAVEDPIGPLNRWHLDQIIGEADLLVPCWGNQSKVPRPLRKYINRLTLALHESGKPVKVFGLTKSGDPMHPLMLGYDTPLVDWKASAFAYAEAKARAVAAPGGAP